MSGLSDTVETLARELPDPEGARHFYERVTGEHPRAARLFESDRGLLADSLALAAWSPLLGSTLAQHPDYLSWLQRQRASPRVKTADELAESLGRFSLTHTQLPPQVLLARFRRRELLRVYLHDLRRAATLVETTEELSNLADAVLRHALQLARQELENLHGAPQCTDERGRTRQSSITVVALGKLGSRELNYSSDIDLLFLYSEDGETSGAGARGAVTNREFFCKLALAVARLVGQPGGEGAAYRVDLRLRPHGRDGAPAVSLAEALRYYREKAHPWELQALIRSRASAGSDALFARFHEEVRRSVFRPEETVARALAHVRLAKQKIDRFHATRERGYNVKLGRGGIREIEFIAQALQLAHGGRDAWLHAPHTLISLGRLVDHRLVSERERNDLSDAYVFLRTLEHRLQMEHGLQTHAVPEDPARRALVARRMHFEGESALAEFDATLRAQTESVRRVYDRVFGSDAETEGGAGAPAPDAEVGDSSAAEAKGREDEPESGAERAAAAVFARRLDGPAGGTADEAERVARLLASEARSAPNPKRARAMLARVAASLDKTADGARLTEAELRALVRLCGASEHFGEALAADPSLAPALDAAAEDVRARDRRAYLRAAVTRERSFRAELSALRRAWSRLRFELAARDAAGEITLADSNRLQTELAAASLNVALLVARREAVRRHGPFAAGPRLCVLGLGRLASGGMDYGSDLDVVVVYDQRTVAPLPGLTHEEGYARITELAVSALSSLTRDGHLYRVDLRLRPDGRNGPVASAGRAFVSYLRERAEVWEWLAHVKLRAVAGDLEFGRAVEREARRAVHESAARAGEDVLRAETRRVRERLERERGARASRRGETDIKYGPGGMLDVYFAARFLQLRDSVADEGEDRSTRATLARLRDAGSLAPADFEALDAGYALLRQLDHHLRLIAGRSTRLPAAPDHPTLADLARRTGHQSPEDLTAHLSDSMSAIRAAYRRVL